MTRLIQHVLSTHHAYVRSALPVLSADLAALVAAEGERHPQLKRVVTLVQELTNELLQHLAKEEQVLFPYILELDASTAQAGGSPFGTVANPISMMEREHVEATQTVRTIRELTDGYQIPADVGPGYELVMRGLHDFERALRRHIHIENNIVFPKAKDLERHSWQR
jgi:regulator of cell morphogenesis and NO signaling